MPVPPPLDAGGCGPGNCSGCCLGGVCIGGTQSLTCGMGGVTCQNCQAQGLVCSDGLCVATPCGPANCTGCCNGQACIDGSESATCGSGGQACQNCSAIGDGCVDQQCVPVPPDAGTDSGTDASACGPSNCTGCCDGSGVCEAGFLDSACGQNGGACANCSAEGQTCDTSVTPRACTAAQCPAPYPGCASGINAMPPTTTTACSASDLANAQAACTGGAETAACQMFFTFEQAMNPSCGSCLAQFDADFTAVVGLLECVLPYVSPSCDHAAGCYQNCVSVSCAQCNSTNVETCDTTVRNGQCGSYFNQLPTCVLPAFLGGGAFCNPNNYGANFGAWLASVGAHYCQ